MKRFLFITILFLFPFATHAATEFESIIDPGGSAEADFSSLSAWEAVMTNTATDLSATTTLVFSGATTGTIANNTTVYQCRGTTYQSVSATLVYDTVAGQALVKGITGTPSFVAGDFWNTSSTCSGATNYFTISNTGDSAIAVATCRTTTGAADTTAVTIDGWTTSAANYIKVWTDPSENYRHGGKWDEGKYRLARAGYDSAGVIGILEDYVRIEGLQVSLVTTNSNPYKIIYVPSLLGATDIRIVGNILRGLDGYEEVDWGFADFSSTVYFYNNTVYDVTIGIITNNINALYAYNNTLVDCSSAIYSHNYKVRAINNIAQNCTDSYSGDFDPSSTHNLTDQSAEEGAWGTVRDNGTTDSASANKLIQSGQNFLTTIVPGMIIKNTSDTEYTYVVAVDSDTQLSVANDIMESGDAFTIYTNMYGSVHFADEANDDFHLDSADTVAKNKGANLYADATLPITTDIDGNDRPNSSSTFDIGADEAITKIYRSVGPSASSALASGGASNYGNLEVKPAYKQNSTTEIADYIATFWRPLPDAVGVGDAIQYDDDGDEDIDASDSIVFITKRIDASHFSVRTASGGAPASTIEPDADWSVYRAYTSLAKAESVSTNADENDSIDDDLENFDNWSNGRDLVANQEQWNLACYAGQGGVADTTAVTIDGWTTSAGSYIKVYTPTRSDEVGASQRHEGKWDDGKYRLDVNSGGALGTAVKVAVYEGLQIRSGDDFGIYWAYNVATDKRVYITNNIIDAYDRGIGESSALWGEAYVYNNIVYGTTVGGTCAIQLNATSSNYFVYNNTVRSNVVGVCGRDTLLAKNNLVDAATTDFYTSSSYHSDSDYNASSDTSAPGSNSRVSQTFTFVDSANNDFRLAPGDTGARNFGTDLSNDEYLPFNTDITSTCLRKDNISRLPGGGDELCYTRPRTSAWDIGAHELITKIYRSVAPEADGSMSAIDDDNSNADTLSIATSGIAIFEVATPDNVGVGDALVWDDDGNNTLDSNDTILFIHGRTDSTHYSVRQQDGKLPDTATTDNDKWAIYRAYTSLSNAEAGTKNTAIPISFTGGNRDIATNSEQWHIACYGNTATGEADTAKIIFNSWTTALQNYLRIYTPYLTSEVGTSQRHSGEWDEGKYRIEVTDPNSAIFSLYVDYFWLDGVQIKLTRTSGTQNAFYVQSVNSSNATKVSSNIFYCIDPSNGDTDAVNITSGGNFSYVWNNIVLGFQDYGIVASNISYVYNNAIINSDVGLRSVTTGGVIARNNISYGNTDNYFGTFNSASINNLSGPSQTDAPGQNPVNAATVAFLDETNSDFHLSPTDTSARNAGADLSQDYYLPISSDIDSNPRISNFQFPVSSHDIGADESATPIYRSLAPGLLTALDTGSADANNLTISGTTMTIGTGAPDNVGVGDALQYDSDGNSTIDALAFISGRASSTEFTVQSRDGGTPVAVTNDQDWSIYRAHSSLSNAEAGTENTGLSDIVEHFDIDRSVAGGKDIWVSNQQYNFVAYANGTTADGFVTIGGWITYPTNYIKVYTPYLSSEVGTSQRHQGKWDTSKFYVSVSNTSGGSIRFTSGYIWIEGLQVVNSASSGWPAVVENNVNSRDSEIRISNNILRGEYLTGVVGAYGLISPYGYVSNSKIWNNIIYGINSGSGGNWVFYFSGGRTYVYNNTVYDSGICYGPIGTVDFIAKNNIAQNCSNGYEGTFDASSDYNISDIAGDTTGGANDKDETEVLFADSANSDFHLASNDTSARNAGIDLTDDEWIPASAGMTADIDGHLRSTSTHSGAWDIGADESATAIYYAVGQNVTTHETGAGTVTVDASARTATFSVAQTAVNMGVGDKLTYDTNKVCYLTGKTSTSIWFCQKADGTAPDSATDANVESITHAFDSLNDAVNTSLASDASEVLGTADLWANNYQLNVPCYYDSGADTTAVTVNGWTTGAPNYLKIYTPYNTASEVNQSQRHGGKWDDSKYRLVFSGAYFEGPVIVKSSHVTIDGLQIANSGNTTSSALTTINVKPTYSGVTKIVGNILTFTGTGTNGWGDEGIHLPESGSGNKVYVLNNIISKFGFSLIINNSYSTLYAYNNTIVDNEQIGVYVNSGSYNRFFNNLVQDSITDYTIVSAANSVYGYNISSDNTAPGTNSKPNTHVQFLDEDNDDFHLAQDDTGAKNYGADLSADTNWIPTCVGMTGGCDIDGNARNIDSRGWDIGADEAATPVYYSVSGGADTADKQTGTSTVDISNGTAVFSTAQTGNIGVGDVISYGSTPDYAYITAKIDASTWTVQTATGTSITGVDDATVNSIKRVFSSLSSAEATAPTLLGTSDLWTNNYQLNLPCYYDTGADTTAVTIDGYTTAPTNFIKVYTPFNTATEANNSQRHGGVWDDNKYNLYHTDEYANALLIKDGYIKIDGLQCVYSGEINSSGGYACIQAYPTKIQKLEISNNILKSAITGTGKRYAMEFYTVYYSSIANIYNNLIMSENYSFSDGIYVGISSQTVNFYNNTIYGCGNGLRRIAGTFVAKNNIAYNNTDNYNGTFHASSANNLSGPDQSDAPGSNPVNNATVQFLDSANDDFRLSPQDNSAYNAGADLSSDQWIPASAGMTMDIEGDARLSGSWDIGADEAPTKIYRSASPSKTDTLDSDNSGAKTIAITSSTATFSSAIADNIGVGDVILYDNNDDNVLDDSDAIAFIHGRSSSTQFEVKTSTGAAPQDKPANDKWEIYRAYTSLYKAERGDENDSLPNTLEDFDNWDGTGDYTDTDEVGRDISANNEQWNIACYANGTTADIGVVTIGSWITAAPSYLKVYTPVSSGEVGTSQRHEGKWDDNKYHLVVNSTDGNQYLGINAAYTQIDGVQMAVSGDGAAYHKIFMIGVNSLDSSIKISNNILKAGALTGSPTGVYGISGFGARSNYLYVWNNIFYGFTTGSSGLAVYLTADSGYTKYLYAYNNTVFDSYTGIVIGGGGTVTGVLKNNITQNCTNGYLGTFDPSSDYNISDIAGDTTGGAHDQDAVEVLFLDSINSDFHLHPNDSAALNAGVNLSSDENLSFSTDIDGSARNDQAWDIGADEQQGATMRAGGSVRMKGVRVED